jgi:hypothetical protein
MAVYCGFQQRLIIASLSVGEQMSRCAQTSDAAAFLSQAAPAVDGPPSLPAPTSLSADSDARAVVLRPK